MRERALVHVGGPRDAGKTTFVERVLDAEVAFTLCVRAVHDAALRKEQASAPKSQPELRRYRDAGAAEVALYRFAERNVDAFFMSDFMQEYSEAVFIEGDLPLDFVDLSVFIAPIAVAGQSLLRRIRRDHTAAHEASLAQLTRALDDPEALARLRKDETIFADVVGFRGSKLPITAVVADLSNPKDAGLTKALARVKRATKRWSR